MTLVREWVKGFPLLCIKHLTSQQQLSSETATDCKLREREKQEKRSERNWERKDRDWGVLITGLMLQELIWHNRSLGRRMLSPSGQLAVSTGIWMPPKCGYHAGWLPIFLYLLQLLSSGASWPNGKSFVRPVTFTFKSNDCVSLTQTLLLQCTVI